MSKLGYSSITLTDLTETLPVSLVLESNLDNYFQTKTGNLYVPNFENGEGVIITPSLYLGQEDLEIEKHPEFVNPAHEGQIRASGFIYYKINEEKYWFNSNTGSDNKIFVDGQGRLHIQKNLNENITIEAFIEDLYNKEHNYTIELVQTSNPINFLFLEEGINQIVASIDCLNGREHFEDRNASDITMIPTLYQGDQILNYSIENGNRIFNNRFSYSWSKISGEVESSKKNQAKYIVERKEISNREYFSCTILDSLTGLTYIASQFIQDFTDTYNCSINYDKALIFTDKETEITLTTEVYFKNQKLEEDADFNLSYNWEAIGSISNEKVELFGEENTLVLNNTTLPEKLKNQNFIIYCSVFQTDSSGLKYQIAGNYLTISYSSDFTIKISPQTIFIPTSSNGDYLGQSSYSFNFQLVDEENNFIKKIESDFLSNQNYDDGAQVNFTEVDESKDEWNFIGSIQFDLNNINNLWENEETFRAYEFSYRYLGKTFTEQILIVKNIVGTQGFSGYTVDWSNDFFAFAGEETIAKPGEVAETEVTAYYGSEALKIESIDIEGQYLYGNESAKDQVVNNILIQAEKINNNKVKIILTTGLAPNFTSVISPIHFNITIKDPIKNSNIVFRKTFNYTINYSGKTYSLFPSAQNIIYKANNTYEPSQIAVNALVKEISGEPYTYEDGKIIYSFDGGIIWKFLSEDKIIKDYLNLDNIIIRLYSNLASFNSTTNIIETILNENARYLLDVETIPVLTSLEGAQIGGENLLPWTKSFKNDFNLLANKWWGDNKEKEEERVFLEELAIIKEGDFNTLEWESPRTETISNNKEEGYSFYSPKILLETEYLKSQFCLSCDIYIESLEETSSFSFFGKFFEGLEETERCIRFGKIEEITINGPGENIKVQDENWREGEWNRISMVFSLEELKNTSLEELPSLESCKYFSIQFNLLNFGKVKVKKPKLELGNITTSWSASPSDLDYSDFEGANLILPTLNTLKFQPEEEVTLLASNLTAGIYTCSWKTLEISESIGGAGLISLNIIPAGKPFSSVILQTVNLPLIEEVEGVQIESKQITFNISSSFDLYLFNQNSQVTFSNFKFERGEKATDYMLTETLADAFIQQFQDNTNEIIGNILILDADGRPVYITPEELQQSIGEVTTKISETEDAILTSVKTSYLSLTDAAPLQQLQSSIHLGYDSDNRGYLQISTIAGFENNNYMKLTDSSLEFYSNNVPVASLTQQTLIITDVKISNSLQIGKIKFMPSDTDGLAVIWEG